MSGSNAGAIILFGVGVLLLNLAYTGRGAAVWAALRSGSTPTPTTDADADADADTETKDGPGGGGARGVGGHGASWRTVRIN